MIRPDTPHLLPVRMGIAVRIATEEFIIPHFSIRPLLGYKSRVGIYRNRIAEDLEPEPAGSAYLTADSVTMVIHLKPWQDQPARAFECPVQKVHEAFICSLPLAVDLAPRPLDAEAIAA